MPLSDAMLLVNARKVADQTFRPEPIAETILPCGRRPPLLLDFDMEIDDPPPQSLLLDLGAVGKPNEVRTVEVDLDIAPEENEVRSLVVEIAVERPASPVSTLELELVVHQPEQSVSALELEMEIVHNDGELRE